MAVTSPVPTGWELKRMLDIAPLQRGFDLPTSQIVVGDFPVVYSNGVLHYHKRAMVKAPGVVTGRSGTIGKVTYVGRDYWPHNTTLWVTNFKGNDEKYVYYLYSHLGIEKFATGSGVPTLNRNDVHALFTTIPKLKREQTAIAVALSDIDALIARLENLIAKKKNIKQGAMSELLTGKRRLPGFTKKWKSCRLGEVCSISAGKSKSQYIVEGGRYWVVDMGSVSIEGKLIVSKSTDYVDEFLKIGDLVMPKDDIGGGNIIGRVGFINRDEKYVLGDHVYCLRVREGAPLFLSYAINSHKINSELRRKVIGSAQLGLGRKSVSEQEIPFPELAEQENIAAAISDMDAEVERLEYELAKYRNIKQGMMQQLLTGKIRLI